VSDGRVWMLVHTVDIHAATKMTPDKIESTLSEATTGMNYPALFAALTFASPVHRSERSSASGG
jgi:hypothetical protein